MNEWIFCTTGVSHINSRWKEEKKSSNQNIQKRPCLFSARRAGVIIVQTEKENVTTASARSLDSQRLRLQPFLCLITSIYFSPLLFKRLFSVFLGRNAGSTVLKHSFGITDYSCKEAFCCTGASSICLHKASRLPAYLRLGVEQIILLHRCMKPGLHPL